jgi:hypothetical protein
MALSPDETFRIAQRMSCVRSALPLQCANVREETHAPAAGVHHAREGSMPALREAVPVAGSQAHQVLPALPEQKNQMSDKPKRRWFRFHLLTAVLMMFATGGIFRTLTVASTSPSITLF